MAADTDNRLTPLSNASTTVEAGKDNLDVHQEEANASEAESRGGDHRPIQDNGTQKYRYNTQGQMTSNNDFPVIPDVFAPPGAPDASEGDSSEFSDIGLNEKVEVAQQGNQLQYGISGPAAGGGNKRNTVT